MVKSLCSHQNCPLSGDTVTCAQNSQPNLDERDRAQVPKHVSCPFMCQNNLSVKQVYKTDLKLGGNYQIQHSTACKTFQLQDLRPVHVKWGDSRQWEDSEIPSKNYQQTETPQFFNNPLTSWTPIPHEHASEIDNLPGSVLSLFTCQKVPQ